MKQTRTHLSNRAGSVSSNTDYAAFTLIELLVVIAIIGILAGLIVGLLSTTSEKKYRSRAQTEIGIIAAAIEVYKSKLGYYPPDNPSDPYKTNHALFNELTHTRIPDDMVARWGVKDIANIGPNEANFLGSLKTTQYTTNQSSGVRADAPGSKFMAGQLVFARDASPYRYNSSSPTNNPDSFDLWVEYEIAGKKYIIGNWRD